MRVKPAFRRRQHPGFTLIELQMVIVLVAFGLVTLASLMATQSRLARRLDAGLAPEVQVPRARDPRVRNNTTAAPLTSAETTQSAPPAAAASATADLTPLP